MTPTLLIRDELLRSYHGPAWLGPALLEALEDISAVEAVQHPLAGVHSIAELMLHCLAWTEEVTRGLAGAEAASPARGDRPEGGLLDQERWQRLRQELEQAAAELDRALMLFPAEQLHERVGGPTHDPPLGSGIRFAVMLHGLARHNAYHRGQIALPKRGLRSNQTIQAPGTSLHG